MSKFVLRLFMVYNGNTYPMEEIRMLRKLMDRINNWMHPKDNRQADHLYHLFFNASDHPPTMSELESACGVEIEKRPVQVGVARVGDGMCDPQKLSMIIKSCTKLCDSDEVLALSDGCNQVIFIFFADTLWEDQTRVVLDDIRKDFGHSWPDTVLYITLGTIEDYSGVGETAWKRSYKVAIGLQDYRYVKPKGKVICHSDIITRRLIYPKGIDFKFDALKRCLENENPKAIQDWLSGLYSAMSDCETQAFGIRYHLTLEIVLNTVSLFREKGLYTEAYIGTPEALIQEVLVIETNQGMQQWTERFLIQCRDALKNS